MRNIQNLMYHSSTVVCADLRASAVDLQVRYDGRSDRDGEQHGVWAGGGRTHEGHRTSLDRVQQCPSRHGLVSISLTQDI